MAGKVMTKAQLVSLIAEKAGITKASANNILEIVSTTAVNETKKNGQFIIPGIGKLVMADRLKKLIASHIGTNPGTAQRMHSGALTVELVPQGTLAERIRSGGAGLGGVLTPTGVGTMVAEGKQTLTIDGRAYLLEKPLRARIALIKAKKGDKDGNLVYNCSSRNFNPLMATAADIVIAEADEIVEPGAIDPNNVHTPGIFVDYLVVK